MGEVISLRPEAELWWLTGLAARGRRDAVGATEAFERVVALWQDHAAAWLALAESRRDIGLLREAEEGFHKALDLDQNLMAAWHGLAGVYRAQGREGLHRFCLGWILMIDPADLMARTGLALSLERSGQNWRAKRHWRTILRQDPLGPQAEMARERLRA